MILTLKPISQLRIKLIYHKQALKAIMSNPKKSCYFPAISLPNFSLILPLVVALTFGGSFIPSKNVAIAQTSKPGATPAPSEIIKAISSIDQLGNRKDLTGLPNFYSDKFTNSDGLNLTQFSNSLKQIWQRYDSLKYRTEIESWQQDGNGIVVTTVTSIEGKQTVNKIEMRLSSKIRSIQRFENKKIVSQETLSERTQVTSGTQPPTVQFNIPEKVKVGEEYLVDAIVQEPLGEDILLGTAVEEAVSEKTLTKPGAMELELLSSGGIFKIGKAPDKPTNLWLSAILMRQGGITLITQRLKVVN